MLNQGRATPAARTTHTYCAMIDHLGTHPANRKNNSKHCRTDARAKWLTTIPGIGVYSANDPSFEIGEIQRFASPKSLYSYAAGWCPPCASCRSQKLR